MSTHNLCFGAKIRKIDIPAYPSFAIQKWGSRGYTLHGHVFLMSVTSWSLQSQKKANFRFKKKRDCTICVGKTKALISCAVTAQLICVFVFA